MSFWERYDKTKYLKTFKSNEVRAWTDCESSCTLAEMKARKRAAWGFCRVRERLLVDEIISDNFCCNPFVGVCRHWDWQLEPRCEHVDATIQLEAWTHSDMTSRNDLGSGSNVRLGITVWQHRRHYIRRWAVRV
jgi:hypothetical protein